MQAHEAVLLLSLGKGVDAQEDSDIFALCFISNGSSGPEETTGPATAVFFSAVWSTLSHEKNWFPSTPLPPSYAFGYFLSTHNPIAQGVCGFKI